MGNVCSEKSKYSAEQIAHLEKMQQDYKQLRSKMSLQQQQQQNSSLNRNLNQQSGTATTQIYSSSQQQTTEQAAELQKYRELCTDLNKKIFTYENDMANRGVGGLDSPFKKSVQRSIIGTAETEGTIQQLKLRIAEDEKNIKMRDFDILQYQEQTKQMQLTLSQQEQKIQELQKELSTIEKLGQKNTHEVESMDKNNKNLQNQLHQTESQNKLLEQKVQELKSQLENWKKEIENSHSANQNQKLMLQKDSQIQQLKDEIFVLSQQIQSMKTDQVVLLNQLNQKLQDDQHQTDKIQERFQEDSMVIQQKIKEIQHLQAQLLALNVQCQQLSTSKIQLEYSIDEQIITIDAQKQTITEFQNQLYALQQEIVELKKIIKMLEDQLQNVEWNQVQNLKQSQQHQSDSQSHIGLQASLRQSQYMSPSNMSDWQRNSFVQPQKLQICIALYHNKNVTQICQNKVKGFELDMMVSDQEFQDIAQGFQKTLHLWLWEGQGVQHYSAQENSMLRIKQPNYNIIPLDTNFQGIRILSAVFGLHDVTNFIQNFFLTAATHSNHTINATSQFFGIQEIQQQHHVNRLLVVIAQKDGNQQLIIKYCKEGGQITLT